MAESSSLKPRLKELGVRVVLLVEVLVLAGVVIGSYGLTVKALLEGRSRYWWFRSDYCADPSQICGGFPWAGIAVFQAVGLLVVIGYLVKVYRE